MQSFDTAKTLLVVDDCEPICELIQTLLVEVGYEVHISTNGHGALKIARAVPEIHLTLCGLDLPDMSGEECVEGCAMCHPSSAVIFISDSDKPIRSLRLFTVLDKPFTVLELRSAVHCALLSPFEQGAPATSPSSFP